MLARLTALSNDHFETNPDEINWGDVGTLNHYAGLLLQITGSAFGEGEGDVQENELVRWGQAAVPDAGQLCKW
jgi:hypothetical protein